MDGLRHVGRRLTRGIPCVDCEAPRNHRLAPITFRVAPDLFKFRRGLLLYTSAGYTLQQSSSIFKVLLEQSDSLFLSTGQIAGLRHADSVYSARVLAAYTPLAEYLAKGSGGAGKTELDSVTTTQKAYWKIFWEQPEIADSIITPTQRELMPLMKNLLGVSKDNRERGARFIFGHQVTLPRRAPVVGDAHP